MDDTRLNTLKQRYQEYLKAEDAILSGAQKYKIGTREFERGDLEKVSDMIEYLDKEIKNEQSKLNGKGRNRTFRAIPRDY